MRSTVLFVALFLTAFAVAFVFSMSGDRESARPILGFIGMSAGNLETEASKLAFEERFDTTEQELVGVVGFDEIQDGIRVQATWFSPDERNMPLGRTGQTTASGANILRFSIGSKVPWKPAPYMLRIDALSATGAITASGSVQFFIGMTDKEVQDYREEFAAWMAAENQRILEASTGSGS